MRSTLLIVVLLLPSNQITFSWYVFISNHILFRSSRGCFRDNCQRVRELTFYACKSFLLLFAFPFHWCWFRVFLLCLLIAHAYSKLVNCIVFLTNCFLQFHSILELINYTQPVYVWREDPDSRQNSIKEIKRRTTSPDGWQQILIFPEGTCSNRKGLITFKPGAFYPDVPVQSVCIRYPGNRLDTLSWTWQGPGAYVSYFIDKCSELCITNFIFINVSVWSFSG
jgi:hypothetical protein